MRVGSLEGRLEKTLFCKNIFVSRFIRLDEIREKERVNTLLQSELTPIVNKHSDINIKSSFSCI
jgi:hypothetical protein